MNKDPLVSIVIPAFNEEKYIENTLFSLLESEQKTNIDYEVILVDNNSTDKTVKLAQKFKRGMNLRIIKEEKQGRGPARARGCREAKGDILLSADSDTTFYSGWVEDMTSSLKGDVVGVTSPSRIVDCSPLTNIIFNFFQPISMHTYRIFAGHYWLSGYSSGVLKSVYNQAGGFNASLHAEEDLELALRVAKFGKIKLTKRAVTFSGRRYKHGLLGGLYDYIKIFFEAFIFKSNIYLDNPR